MTKAAARPAQVKGREIDNTGIPRIQGVISDQTNGWMKILRAEGRTIVFMEIGHASFFSQRLQICRAHSS
jgi:hypothetical protein